MHTPMEALIRKFMNMLLCILILFCFDATDVLQVISSN